MESILNYLNLLGRLPEFDLLYLLITIYFVFQCTTRGLVLSLFSASKWVLAYMVTLLLFPKAKPYVNNLINNEYILNIGLGICLFIVVIFIIFLITKIISKAIIYSGLGTFDRVFGFFFGFIKAYIVSICIFATADIIYDHKKWAINLNQSLTFPWVEKGSNYLIKEFPTKKQYNNAKKKVKNI